jgi:VWFA-related protein
MTIDKRFFLASLATLLLAGAVYGQETAPLARNTPPARIYLDVVVAPKSGSPVAGLQQQDFKVLDNKAPQPITSFQAFDGGKTPVEVVLVIDAVNTSYQNIAYERGEIGKFLLTNGGHLANPTTLAIFTDKGTQMQEGFTSDGNAINDALTKYTVGLRDIRPSEGFYGAEERFQLSLKALNSLVSHVGAGPGRKIIIWLSPGWPLLSGPNIQYNEKQLQTLFAGIVDLSNLLHTTRTTLYSVNSLGTAEGIGRTFYYQEFTKGVRKPGQALPGDLSIQVLATQSGGMVLDSTGVAGLLQQCIADTQTYYELTFNAQRADRRDEYHQIEVQVAKPGLVARTSQGYYAQP